MTTTTSARRTSSQGKAAGAGRTAAEPPKLPSLGDVARGAKASTPEPEKEEVTIEPDIPAEGPNPTPAGPAPDSPSPEPGAGPDDPQDSAQPGDGDPDPDPEPELSVEEQAALEVEAFLALTPAEQGAATYFARVAAMDPEEPVYVAGNRAPRLKVGDYTLQPGEIVPGAHGWPRREAYERLGRIERR